MTAKQQAIKDIKDDLKRSGKCFITFHSELNPVMDSLVSEYIKEQKSMCLSCWTLKTNK